MDWSGLLRGSGSLKRNPIDLDRAFEMVPEKIAHAARLGADALNALGERYALIGGLAVSAHGAPRLTKDVDFLVGGKVFRMHSSGIVTFVEGVPINAHGIDIDYLVAEETFLKTALDKAEESRGIPILAPEPLILLKLRANRRQDRIDVGALVRQAGVDEGSVIDYLGDHEPALLPRFQRALDEWDAER